MTYAVRLLGKEWLTFRCGYWRTCSCARPIRHYGTLAEAQAAAAWLNQVGYRDGDRRCRQCGRVWTQERRGPRAVHCSDACRKRYAKVRELARRKEQRAARRQFREEWAA